MVCGGLKQYQILYLCNNLSIIPFTNEEQLKKDLQTFLKNMYSIGMLLPLYFPPGMYFSVVSMGYTIFPESSSLSTSAIADVRWSDLGGMEEAKKEVYDLISIPLKFRGQCKEII